MFSASEAAWINTPYRKTFMNHKTKVNTTPSIEQANNDTLPLLQLNTLRQHLSDIESQTYTSMAFGEMAREKVDRLNEVKDAETVSMTILHLEALTSAALRSLELILDAAAAISLALSDAEGGAA